MLSLVVTVVVSKSKITVRKVLFYFTRFNVIQTYVYLFVILDAVDEGANNGKKSIVPRSITGSPRHLRSLALDALATVADMGPPTMFFTLTCNTKWREI